MRHAIVKAVGIAGIAGIAGLTPVPAVASDLAGEVVVSTNPANPTCQFAHHIEPNQNGISVNSIGYRLERRYTGEVSCALPIREITSTVRMAHSLDADCLTPPTEQVVSTSSDPQAIVDYVTWKPKRDNGCWQGTYDVRLAFFNPVSRVEVGSNACVNESAFVLVCRLTTPPHPDPFV